MEANHHFYRNDQEEQVPGTDSLDDFRKSEPQMRSTGHSGKLGDDH